MKTVLTVAGSDPSGGAGIQADLKTFQALGTYGMSVLTSITAQNTRGVQGSVHLRPDFVRRQLDSVFDDIRVDAVKTGMLANRGLVEVVAQKLDELGAEKLVVDPVMVAKSGDPLVDEETRDSLLESLIPMARIITPNQEEAGVLSGLEIRDREDLKRAAREIFKKTGTPVIIKAARLGDMALDLFMDEDGPREYRAELVTSRNLHGTGCTFSAAICALMARGLDLHRALREAKKYITAAIRYGPEIGHGHAPVNHMVWQKSPGPIPGVGWKSGMEVEGPAPVREEVNESEGSTITDLEDGRTDGPAGEGATLRILDANLNRCREGLRVVEEVVRFILDDPGLTSRCKKLRHRLREGERELLGDRGHRLLLSRDSEGDVGARGLFPSEQLRGGVGEVVTANFKRLQEGLRVLEEFGKLTSPGASRIFKEQRFAAYTLEKDLWMTQYTV